METVGQYAACSVAESYLIKKGMASSDIDLSEAHLNYYMYHNKAINMKIQIMIKPT